MKGVERFQILVARNPQTVTDAVQLSRTMSCKSSLSISCVAEDTAETSTLVSDVAPGPTALLLEIKQSIHKEVAHPLSLVAQAPEPVTVLDRSLQAPGYLPSTTAHTMCFRKQRWNYLIKPLEKCSHHHRRDRKTIRVSRLEHCYNPPVFSGP